MTKHSSCFGDLLKISNSNGRIINSSMKIEETYSNANFGAMLANFSETFHGTSELLGNSVQTFQKLWMKNKNTSAIVSKLLGYRQAISIKCLQKVRKKVRTSSQKVCTHIAPILPFYCLAWKLSSNFFPTFSQTFSQLFANFSQTFLKEVFGKFGFSGIFR